MAAADSKEAQAMLIDPFNEPEPSADTGPGSHFGSTFAPKPSSTGASKQPTVTATESSYPAMSSKQPTATTTQVKEASPRSSLGSRNPFRESLDGTSSPNRQHGTESFPDYRNKAFGDQPIRRSGSGARPPVYELRDEARASGSGTGRARRSSSLKERYPGDDSVKPLDVIRRGSKKADRSAHLNKRHMPGADVIDRLDPALGGRAYHHEGPYDAALLARNSDPRDAPIAALKSSNEEALKATPREHVKDALDKHKPLDGVAVVPPGQPDQFGRTYNYEEGTDLMHEGMTDAGYKRWGGTNYDPEDLKGQSEPSFTLDRALQAHKIDDNGIEMEDRAGIDRAYHKAQRDGTLDTRDPRDIAGDEGKYVDLELKNMPRDSQPVSHSLKNATGSIKRRLGSLRHRHTDNQEGFLD